MTDRQLLERALAAVDVRIYHATNTTLGVKPGVLRDLLASRKLIKAQLAEVGAGPLLSGARRW